MLAATSKMAQKILLFSSVAFCIVSQPTEASNKQLNFNISIAQIVEHPSLDLVRQGILESLEKAGLKKGAKIEYLNAQGNMVTLGQIAKKILSEQPDAAIAIGTPAAQALINKNNSIPVVFSPITDPVGAKLVTSIDRPGGIATGSSDRSPVVKQLELIQEIVPNVKKIAILYNAGEANSRTLVDDFKEACRKFDLIPVEGVVQNSAGVLAAASSVQADVIYVPTDNTVVSAIEAVIRAGVQRKIPVITAEGESVAKGALASLAVDYYQLGLATGQMLVDILQHKSKPSEMPVKFAEHFKLHINSDFANKYGVTLKKELLQKAEVVH